ncbi:HWE histidine kinase domain-containing protein [Aurantiacibacter sp. MUD61]|uniref:HWE histidine kinase domain-containing protein n=1 Tax=Aurantiacibacter sp. MUD61 TaxID=3009083 RepID=UPI0022F03686|nr:HWE histidine kinase domain-containing protein [Aurantiacibacter sp. MUD61]
MNVHSQPVDLTSCDREPIHQLGHIQDFGALIAVTADWNVAFRSANLDDVLQARSDVGIGDRLSDHLSADALSTLRERISHAREMEEVERIFGVDLLHDNRIFDVAVHISGDYIVIEIEPTPRDGANHQTSALRPVMRRLEQLSTIPELCDAAARELKTLLGFDRVMVYRFHPDESGEVIAEARERDLEAFHGLRYPASDIPKQARQLYLRNLFRIISDVDATPVPIEPATTLDGAPIDLSMSTLRSVSPIHIQYLQNMGVKASLSISIVVRGKLWGLFACHNYSAKVLPFPVRTMAELFSQLFSMQLDLAIVSAGHKVRDKARILHEKLMSVLVGGGSLSKNLGVIEESIEKIIPHDGLSAYIDGEYTSRGHAPSESEFAAIIPSLNTSSTGRLVHNDSLAGIIPAAGAFADKAAGALIIPVSRRPRDYVVLWRREMTQVVTWAGNPQKPVQAGPDGDRLTPRESFAAWKEEVSGKSAPWTEEELLIAENLRVTLLEVILRITDEQMQERTRAQERQELLIAELNHRVRNILTLIRSLIGQSKSEATDIGQFADMVGGRIRALALAHDQITRKQWSPASLKELILAEAEAYLSDKADRVTITGPDALISPEAFTVLALVIHEMMTNSAKYGCLCDRKGHLEIALEFNRHTDLEIHWREIGGPPVKAPKRRGFGSTIIEKSIPYELKGDAQIRYELSGVEADFVIPSNLVDPSEHSEEKDAEDAAIEKERSARVSKSDRRDGVLVVEDSMIIAMDAEEMLSDMGFANINVAASCASALDMLESSSPAFAMLDFNLGDETSEPVAKALAERGIPFWFVTGYGEAMDKLTRTEARGVIQKPYAKSDLEKIVAELKS